MARRVGRITQAPDGPVPAIGVGQLLRDQLIARAISPGMAVANNTSSTFDHSRDMPARFHHMGSGPHLPTERNKRMTPLINCLC